MGCPDWDCTVHTHLFGFPLSLTILPYRWTNHMILENGLVSRPPGLSAGKLALLERRLRGEARNQEPAAAIVRRDPTAHASLSFSQRQLWFLDQLAPSTPLYNISTALRLRGDLNRPALARALALIVQRHESLRTRFVAIDGEPTPIVDPAPPLELEILQQTEAEVSEKLRELARVPFDLSRDLMLRVRLLQLSSADHVLSITIHHIAADGWSLGLFFRELTASYDRIKNGRDVSLPDLPVQFSDFASSQMEWTKSDRYQRQLTYWRQQLLGAPSILEMPADRSRPAVQSFQGASETLTLPRELSHHLKALSRREGVTPFMSLLTAFQVLLHRYTRQTDILVGTAVAGRNQLETENVIGFFANALVLRADLSGEPTFRECLQRARQTILGALAHQDLPFEKLVEELRVERNLSHNPLFQVVFVLQGAPTQPASMDGLSLLSIEVPTNTSKFDLTLLGEMRDEALHLTLEYNTDLFDLGTGGRILAHFRSLLEAMTADPAQGIRECSLLAEPERHKLLFGWNRVSTDYPRNKSIVELFEEQVEHAPDAIAVEFEGHQLSYTALNQRANQLAHYLQKQGLTPGSIVAVYLERSQEMIVGLLAILKAGCAYLPIDAAQPPERLGFMLEDANVRVCLAENAALDFEGRDSPTRKSRLVSLNDHVNDIALESPLNPGCLSGPASLAYVSFTSGSSGKPKGVCVPHRAVVRLVRGTNYARFNSRETFLQLAPIAFDASTFEIWGALLNGAKLVLFPPRTPSLAELGDFIRNRNITTLWLTAGLFHQMVDERVRDLRGVRQLLAGGDVLSVPHVAKALEALPNCRLINGYGPTENTTFTCCHLISPADVRRRSIPIGRPVANTNVFVLDELRRPTPVGVPGELAVGGDGLATGYLNNPEMTAAKFIPNPFTDDPTARLYLTGDLVRWLPDGTLEFVGRLDLQAKVRGFRVEPGEIEATLAGHKAVKQCVVVPTPDARGDTQLIAYFALNFELDSAELRGFLEKRLPAYMIPSAFVPLDALPLNVNGKVDRKALPKPSHDAHLRTTGAFIPPSNDLERQLAKLWEEVLGVSPISMEDHFFRLGGNSLLAVRLVASIARVVHKKIPVAAIFHSHTIAQLARRLRNESPADHDSSIVEIQPHGSKQPLFLVHGVGGGMFWGYTNLSRHFGTDQPVFAFNSRGMNGQPELPTIEEIAAKYVADLRAFRPQGPYCLGGYCFGGNVAYEMARQLRALGEEISLLALINCAPPFAGYSRFRLTPASIFKFLSNLHYRAKYAWQIKNIQQRAFLLWKCRVFRKRILRLITRSRIDVDEVVDLTTQPEDRRRLWAEHVRAMIAHRTKPYPGKVTLFRTGGHPVFCSFDDAFGWREFAGEVEVTLIPGVNVRRDRVAPRVLR